MSCEYTCLSVCYYVAVKDNSRYDRLQFDIDLDTVLHGFGGYFYCVLYADIAFSTFFTLRLTYPVIQSSYTFTHGTLRLAAMLCVQTDILLRIMLVKILSYFMVSIHLFSIFVTQDNWVGQRVSMYIHQMNWMTIPVYIIVTIIIIFVVIIIL